MSGSGCPHRRSGIVARGRNDGDGCRSGAASRTRLGRVSKLGAGVLLVGVVAASASRPEIPGGRAARQCALRVLSRRVRGMTPRRRKRRGESVPSPEQDKAEVVRAVLTSGDRCRPVCGRRNAHDHRHAPLLLWPGGRNHTATRASTRPVDADVVPTHGDVIVSEGPGDEVSAVRM
jgi:hypothetical protein